MIQPLIVLLCSELKPSLSSHNNFSPETNNTLGFPLSNQTNTQTQTPIMCTCSIITMDQSSTTNALHLVPLSKPCSSELLSYAISSQTSQTKQNVTRSIEPESQDMFQVYSTEGLLAHELEAFGITRKSSTRQNESKSSFSSRRKNRKSRVSTEVHPDLLFAEFLSEDWLFLRDLVREDLWGVLAMLRMQLRLGRKSIISN